MAFKIQSTELIRIAKLLEKCDLAINLLEKRGKNKIIYPSLKRQIKDELMWMKQGYELEQFSEWKKPLEQIIKENTPKED